MLIEAANPQAVEAFLRDLHERIVVGLEALDGGVFKRDEWQRPPEKGGGGGISCLLEDGALFERAGVGFSHVKGTQMPASATAHRPELAGRAWEAMGVSLVMHPRNPYVPTVHLNVRFFRAFAPGRDDVFWFGGGMDLTPYYGFEKDAVRFHGACQTALAPFGEGLYPKYKAWCDDYFYLKHRAEPRGIGGIFFDDLSGIEGAAGGVDFAQSFALMRSVGEAFLPVYSEIVARRRTHAYGERERDWQAYRRGRYVEFNLVWDRGTLFGLQSGGRTESILMSMPPVVKWRYDYHPEAGSPEDALLTDFLRPRAWL